MDNLIIRERAADSGPDPAALTSALKAQKLDDLSVTSMTGSSQAESTLSAAPSSGALDAFKRLVETLHTESFNAGVFAPGDYGDWQEYAQTLLDAHAEAGVEGVRRVWRVWCKDRPELAVLYGEPGEPDEQPARPATTLADLAGVLPRTNWLWESWLPCGYLTLLVGATGVGKSWLTLRLAQSVLTGKPWPDGAVSHAVSPIIWADTEASQALLLERAQNWHLPIDNILLPTVGSDPLSDIRLDDDAGWEELVRLIGRYRPHLVVVDSLSGAYKGDENSSDTRNLLHDLAMLARNYNVAVLATHHLRKANPMEALDEITIDRIRGSSAIPQFARLVMALDRPDAVYEPDRVRLKVIKSNLARFPKELGFEITDHGLHFGKAPAPPVIQTQAGKASQLILDLLAQGPVPSTVVYNTAVARGISKNTLRRAKDTLPVEVVRQGNGWCWQMAATPGLELPFDEE